MSDDVLQDYEAEQSDLYGLLAGLSDGDWRLPTPAVGWDVRDQVSHLADTEDVAHDTMTDGPRSINVDAAQYGSAEGFTEAGCDRGRALGGPAEVLEWWWQAAARVRSTMAGLDRSTRVPWGLGMGWQAFVTARLMEHWAHGLDIRTAVGQPGVDTDRLRHVAWISTRAVPYALRVSGVEAPEGHTLRFALEGVGGGSEVWAFGPDDATDVITGPASQWCRLAVQRIGVDQAPDLRGEGPLAELALAHARAFL